MKIPESCDFYKYISKLGEHFKVSSETSIKPFQNVMSTVSAENRQRPKVVGSVFCDYPLMLQMDVARLLPLPALCLQKKAFA